MLHTSTQKLIHLMNVLGYLQDQGLMQKVNYLFSTLHKYHIFITLNKNKAGNLIPNLPKVCWPKFPCSHSRKFISCFLFGQVSQYFKAKEVSLSLFVQVSQYINAQNKWFPISSSMVCWPNIFQPMSIQNMFIDVSLFVKDNTRNNSCRIFTKIPQNEIKLPRPKNNINGLIINLHYHHMIIFKILF